ncbi:hypothetical protein [Sphingobium amiense]|uniref:hypothetical protein n=1 Tax=Sphingobium amiense TaxID=135719 RepID=UPI000F823D7C|nr:hypothetical protein [Sphingobium amiense]
MDRAEGFALDAPCVATVKRPRQNRVTPFGTIEATHHKGSLMGNRGDLHAPDGTLGREWRSRRWLSCILDGKGWKAPMDTPGHYYPLFFHDEAVAMAAGHRPCGECRPAALAAFITAWKIGQGFSPRDWVPLRQIDQGCHGARISERTNRRKVELSNMPDGVFVFAPEIDRRPLLWQDDMLWPWQHGGYGHPISRCKLMDCIQLTPEPMVASLRAGYVPLAGVELQPVANF